MIDLVRQHTIPAAFSVLPPMMTSLEATALLITIGLQESRFTARRQIGGPARGWWMFERAGVHGVVTHKATRDHLVALLPQLQYPVIYTTPQVKACHTVLEHNDVLAACFARLLLWTLPVPLPGPQEYDASWGQYLAAWKPGKPHRETWNGFFGMAWSLVAGAPAPTEGIH